MMSNAQYAGSVTTDSAVEEEIAEDSVEELHQLQAIGIGVSVQRR